MAKETRRQIIEQTRNEVAKVYSVRIKKLEEDIKNAEDKYWNERKLRIEAQTERDMLKDKINQLEDWTNRLQEFMDMPEESRKEYLEQQKVQKILNNKMGSIMSIYSQYMSLF